MPKIGVHGNHSKCFIDYLKLKLVAFIEFTIVLIDGKIYNSKVFWLPSQKMMLFQSLIL